MTIHDFNNIIYVSITKRKQIQKEENEYRNHNFTFSIFILDVCYCFHRKFFGKLSANLYIIDLDVCA